MSKVSIKMIVGLSALIMKGLNAALRAVRVIRDLMDDGQLNGSADLPTWLDNVQSAIDSAVQLVDTMTVEYAGLPLFDDSKPAETDGE